MQKTESKWILTGVAAFVALLIVATVISSQKSEDSPRNDVVLAPTVAATSTIAPEPTSTPQPTHAPAPVETREVPTVKPTMSAPLRPTAGECAYLADSFSLKRDFVFAVGPVRVMLSDPQVGSPTLMDLNYELAGIKAAYYGFEALEPPKSLADVHASWLKLLADASSDVDSIGEAIDASGANSETDLIADDIDKWDIGNLIQGITWLQNNDSMTAADEPLNRFLAGHQDCP